MKKIFESFSDYINENASDGYNKWKNALKLYNEEHSSEEDEAFSDLFDGSKVSARFIFRSTTSSNSKANYDKDCKEFGKSEVDSIVNQVIEIKKN